MTKESTLKKFEQEMKDWERLISYFQQENITFKSRLTDMVNSSYENDQLFSAESYLEDFISQDRMISFFRDELKLHAKLLKNCYISGEPFSEIKENQHRLRMDFIKAEQSFFNVKERFGVYLAEK